MIGCCWVAQEGPLEGEGWWVAIEKFISVMVQKKREWIEVKELTPLKYMPYMAKLFREVTGKDLQGLGQFTGWIGLGGYYHWRVVQQGLIHQVPHLQDEPIPRTPNSHPSGRPLPVRPSSTVTLAMGAWLGHRVERNQLPREVGQDPPRTREVDKGPPRTRQGALPPPAKVEGQRPQVKVRGHQPPHQGATPTTSGGSTNLPTSSQGAGDSTWANWYQLALREPEGRISEPQGPPFPIASAQVRWESVGQIYG